MGAGGGTSVQVRGRGWCRLWGEGGKGGPEEGVGQSWASEGMEKAGQLPGRGWAMAGRRWVGGLAGEGRAVGLGTL